MKVVDLACYGNGTAPYIVRLCDSKLQLERGQLVIVQGEHIAKFLTRFAVVAEVRELDKHDRFEDSLDAAITPNEPDSIITNKLGTIRIYNWRVPAEFQATYWLDTSGPIYFSNNKATVGEELRQKFNERFFEKVEQ